MHNNRDLHHNEDKKWLKVKFITQYSLGLK
jgi:hypothetical protein